MAGVLFGVEALDGAAFIVPSAVVLCGRSRLLLPAGAARGGRRPGGGPGLGIAASSLARLGEKLLDAILEAR